jgi:hypothetical protein
MFTHLNGAFDYVLPKYKKLNVVFYKMGFQLYQNKILN